MGWDRIRYSRFAISSVRGPSRGCLVRIIAHLHRKQLEARIRSCASDGERLEDCFGGRKGRERREDVRCSLYEARFDVDSNGPGWVFVRDCVLLDLGTV